MDKEEVKRHIEAFEQRNCIWTWPNGTEWHMVGNPKDGDVQYIRKDLVDKAVLDRIQFPEIAEKFDRLDVIASGLDAVLKAIHKFLINGIIVMVAVYFVIIVALYLWRHLL